MKRVFIALTAATIAYAHSAAAQNDALSAADRTRNMTLQVDDSLKCVCSFHLPAQPGDTVESYQQFQEEVKANPLRWAERRPKYLAIRLAVECAKKARKSALSANKNYVLIPLRVGNGELCELNYSRNYETGKDVRIHFSGEK